MAKGRPVGNPHKVPKDQWQKWSRLAQQTFNDMMHYMATNRQHLYLHPEATPQKRKHWQTTRWNAAWMAAHAVNDRTK